MPSTISGPNTYFQGRLIFNARKSFLLSAPSLPVVIRPKPSGRKKKKNPTMCSFYKKIVSASLTISFLEKDTALVYPCQRPRM